MLRRTVYLPLAGIALFVVLAVARLPLSLALDISGVRAQGVDWAAAGGTVWQGTIAGVSLDGYPIGTVTQRTRFLPLLTGRVFSEIEIAGRPVNGEGRVSLAGERVTLSDAAFLVDLSAYNVVDAFGAPLRGTVRLETDNLQLRGERCQSGVVSLWTDSLSYSARSWGGEGFPLAGTATCGDDGVLRLALSGEGNGQTVAITGTLDPTLDYLAEVTAGGLEEDVATALTLYGFEQTGDDLVLIQRGNLLVNP
ncbi:type II secretion system protein N [Aquisalinus flavus]|uniref:Type II secretion system protein N n=1 Tax=Aquisalinus flavus TaxID=1526572 RepID=A0A8J2V724_9PROT|nr:type II secretion system protein N [Aquisalinus flavus]MBD0427329.1 type II secretion system protein N [Aquisalinus flavus]UNE47135.1 type II secretion system protein N [Aquisalinus flavus]GGD00162.1 hypothetical protein GCM10011342_06440 [Aquisalinus flavus]